MSESDSEIVKEFLVESYENLDRLDRELVGLEKNPGDHEALGSVFRTIHTIKGTCGFLGFNKLEKVAHVGENLLTRLRDGQLTLNPELTTALLGMVDAVRGMLSQIEKAGQEGERDDSVLIATLTRLQQLPEAPPKIEVAALPKSPSQAAEVPPNIGDILMQRTDVSPAEIMLAAKQQNEGDPRRLGEILVERGSVQSADIVDALHIQQSSRAQASASDSTIRVDVGLLDKVMNLVGGFHEFVPEVGMGYSNKRKRPFPQTLALQSGNSVLGNDVFHAAARGDHPCAFGEGRNDSGF